MRAKIMKWVSMTVLLSAVLYGGLAANYLLFLGTFVVCLGACVVVVQAVRARKYINRCTPSHRSPIGPPEASHCRATR